MLIVNKMRIINYVTYINKEAEIQRTEQPNTLFNNPTLNKAIKVIKKCKKGTSSGAPLWIGIG